jgi:hypothetical protein
MRWFILFLVVLSFVASGLILWIMTVIHYPILYRDELSRFILESGAGLIACMLGSTLLVNDAALELLLASRQGCWKIVIERTLLLWIILSVIAVCFVGWTSALGIQYSSYDTPWRLFCMWFVPTWLFTMLSLMASLLAKNSSMGGVLSGILLLLELIMKDFFLNTSSLLLIFVPISMWKPDSHLWWSSRALLFGLGALIVLGIWRWIRREEHLLDAITS